jgi:two-component system KDP operon response regulator KdpE
MGYDASSGPFESVPALRMMFALKPDVVIFDADSGGSPRELFHMLVAVSQLPVLVIGSSSDDEDLVWYLDHGAAVYIPKPVSADLIAARVRSVLRRSEVRAPDVLRSGDITFDAGRREVRKRGEMISLTPTEFRLLGVLVRNNGRPCSRRQLLAEVWGPDFVSCTHYLTLYIGYLRSKLEDDPRRPKLLLTEWGMGYRLVAAEAAAEARPAGSPAVAAS